MLDVTANDLHDIVGLDGLSGLDALGLGQNHFVTVRPLTHLQILRWLDIHNNEISDISDLGSLTDLQYLRLDGNHICSLPPAVAKLREEHVNSKGQLIKLEVTGLEHQTGCRESF